MTSTLQIEERFLVDAPVDRLWPFLLDPEKLVVCLPGAELTEVEGERTFHGNMKVKVGPVTISYKGTIELTEVNEVERLIRMDGKGKEKGGAGSAKMAMVARIEQREVGGCEVVVEADVQLAGKIVRFGRGMIQSVSKQLFKRFSSSVQEIMTEEPATRPSSSEGGVEPEGPESQRVEEKVEPVAPAKVQTREVAPREVKPIRLLPLLFRAIWDGIVGLFARLFRRKGGG